MPRRRAHVDARRGGALSRCRRSAGASASTSTRASNRCRTRRQQAARAGARVRRSARADGLRRASSRAACRSPSRSTVPRAPRSSAAARSTRERHGQMNLACTQCHDQNWGKRLLGRDAEPGPRNAFPAYRLEWQASGLAAAAHSRVPVRHPRADAAAGRARARPTSSSISPGARRDCRSRRRACADERIPFNPPQPSCACAR